MGVLPPHACRLASTQLSGLSRRQTVASDPRAIRALAVAGLCAASSARGQTPGPIAYLPFDGNMLDSGPSHFNAVPHGNLTYVPGHRGQAARFNGVDTWIDLQHSGALTFDLDTQ